MEYRVEGLNIIVVAIAVWFLGSYLNKKLIFLDRFNIPVAVTGGIFCSAIITISHFYWDLTVVFDNRLRDLLLLAFFSTIGLSANIRLLKEGGKSLVVLLFAAAVLLIAQDGTGVLLAWLMEVPPAYGLFGGSISLAGGHGTAIAWGSVAEEAGLVAAKEVGIAFATFGLIAGGLIGGPIAAYLVRKHKLAPNDFSPYINSVDSVDIEKASSMPTVSAQLTTLMMLAICIKLGDLVNQFLFSNGITLPGFLTAMMVGILIANTSGVLRINIDPISRERVGEISLQLFLAMSLMSMQLWVLADAIMQILFVLFVQMTIITLFSAWFVFRIMGRNYDACVIAAGFTGLGMGATPVGIANMNAVTSKYGPSPKAFLIVPLVGAFFLDIVNALVIKAFLTLPAMSVVTQLD